jgi:phosphohistidine phosphatase
MREVIQGLCPAPDVILVSSARRTMQTLEALAPWRETPMAEVMDQLYLASAAQILAVLNGLAETVRSAMVIGHNPGMHELACLLAGASATPRLHAGYPTAALAAFSIPGPWRPLGAGGAELVRFIRPKDIPGMADATED